MTTPEKNEKTEKKKKAPAPSAKVKVSAKLSLVQDALALMEASQVSELRFEQGDTKIHLRKGPGISLESYAPAPVMTMAAPVAVAPAAGAAPAAPAPAADKTVTVAAPMVGTFYRAASPDAKPFVEEGGKIEVGQVYCIIEAMKLMNEVKAEVKGKIVKILVANGQAVEFGQPLLIVDPS
ncbi:MAG TPA: acetyl-CoA carboxylase biotin carboxyl carrier protein [bacterium]|nr:acetyl-CoA carboxylase biotin carboxyl carrier protein [bacterium]